jgi:hypothetical protein
MVINLLQTIAAMLFFFKIQQGKNFVVETVTAPFLLDTSQVGIRDFGRPPEKLIVPTFAKHMGRPF